MLHLQLDRVALAYEETGVGEPVVFLHEFAGSMKDWADQVHNLAVDHRAVVFNCRGYPPSAVPPDPIEYSQELAVADLRGLLDGLGIARAVLIGLSMGGSTALNFAIRYPERVQGLILASSGSGSDDKAAFLAQFGTLADLLEREGSATFADQYLRGPTRIQLLRKRPSAWLGLRDELSAMPAGALASTIRGIMLRRPTVYELEAGLRKLNVPALILVGEEDSPVLRPADFLVKSLPSARLVVLRRTGHTVNLEEPTEFNRVVRGYLAGLA
jgi:pimeloyl-ACP methyl ester carboxylesterase